MSEIVRMKCGRISCTESYESTLAGRKEAWATGWFIAKYEMDAWCPEHIPEWALNYLKRKGER